MIRRIIAFALGIILGTVIWSLASCQKQKNTQADCMVEYETMLTTQEHLANFCTQIGVPIEADEEIISAVQYTDTTIITDSNSTAGITQWYKIHSNNNLVSAWVQSHETYMTLYEKWWELRYIAQSAANKYNTCLGN